MYGGKGVVNVAFVGKLLRRVTTETEDSITVPSQRFSSSMMSSVGSGSLTIDCSMVLIILCKANRSGIPVNRDFVSKDTNL